MRARLLFAGIILSLFVSSWGTVLAAAMCPHMAADHSCCHAMHKHGRMTDMAMTSDMQMSPIAVQSPAASQANTFSQPLEACAHCLGHSQLPPRPVTLREADQTKRGVKISAPFAADGPNSLIPLRVPAVLPRPHAPPGVMPARHGLLSVFRI